MKMISHSNHFNNIDPAKRMTASRRIAHLFVYHTEQILDEEYEILSDMKFYGVNAKFIEANLKYVGTLEAKYCTQMCHALNKADIPHS